MVEGRATYPSGLGAAPSSTYVAYATSTTLEAPLHDTPFATRLDRFAAVAVKVGLNIQPGQELLLTGSTDALPLIRRIAAQAYRAGASLVTPILSDDAVTLARYENAPDESFDRATSWLFDGMATAYRGGAARMHVAGDAPGLLAGQDPARVARVNKARALAYRPALDLIVNTAINWSIVACASPGWAKQVFPDLAEDAALARLWDAVFAASRIDVPDPVANWAAHNAQLRTRRDQLTQRQFAALRFHGPGTDLEVGLAEGHVWMGGATTAQNGVVCNPNIPTEEVFTMPHARRVNGTVRSTKPLDYQGSLIRDIAVRFAEGAVVEAHASTGQSVLERMLDSDEGARRLGEVALVPYSSPISQTGLLFYNTLFDENAASHIALGQSYSRTVADGTSLAPDELTRRGANSSIIHVDWMIGSDEIDVDGLTADGGSEKVMRRGEWALPA
jgi:aminopeptidase